MEHFEKTTGSLSIKAKIGLAVGGIMLLIVSLLTMHSYVSSRSNNLEMATEQVRGMNAFYFDSLNTLMIADSMEERETLRRKLLEMPGVLDARVLRANAVSNKFGEGLDNENPKDDLDHRALAGESILQVNEASDGRILTIVEPYRLTENTRGTNCLECHRGIDSGTIGSAVRIDYSLKRADALAADIITEKMIGTLLMFGVALTLLTLLLNRLVVHPLRSVMSRVRDIAAGEGDLTHTITHKSQDELGELAYWFNVFIGKLNNMVNDIRIRVDQLGNAAGHLNSTTEQTRSSMQLQSREISNVTAAMDNMADSVEQVTLNARETAEAAELTNNQANTSKAVMDQTISLIGILADEVAEASATIALLDQKSNEINMVLEVIRNIAEQTNLLALNAAIEAARAGEQGRGFAVVADEVRTLAERTQNSTVEIQTMIESLQQGTKDAVQRMSLGKSQADNSVQKAVEAGHSLQTIIEAVARISNMSENIAAAADQHSHASSHTGQHVGNIQNSASQTAKDAADVSVAGEQLTQIAQALHELVGQFKTHR